MGSRVACRARIVGVVFAWLVAGLPSAPVATAQGTYVIKPVTERRLKELPAGALYWRIEQFRTLPEAQTAAGPTSLAADIAGTAWLFTLGPKDDVAAGVNKAVEIGPLPRIEAPEYLLRINYVVGPPGAKTAVHTHPGSETFYVLTGQLGQKTPHGVSRVEAGQSMAGHSPGMPMEVSSAGTTELTALVMFVVDATKPFSSPAQLD